MGGLKKLIRKVAKVVGIAALLYTGVGAVGGALKGAGMAAKGAAAAKSAAAAKTAAAAGSAAAGGGAASGIGAATTSLGAGGGAAGTAAANAAGAASAGGGAAAGGGAVAGGVAAAKAAAPYVAGAYALNAAQPQQPNINLPKGPTAIMPDEETQRRVARRMAGRAGSTGRSSTVLTSTLG